MEKTDIGVQQSDPQEPLDVTALALYRRGQDLQREGSGLAAILPYLLSIAASGYHPNALYQVAFILAQEGRVEEAHGALDILLKRTPLHESGRRLQLLIDVYLGNEIQISNSPDALRLTAGEERLCQASRDRNALGLPPLRGVAPFPKQPTLKATREQLERLL